jgi:glycosyltransferase involved in cell wall biosynthesis
VRILIVHNHYGGYSGESSVMEQHQQMLKSHGHDVDLYTRSSLELDAMFFGKVRAFFAGLYNPYSIDQINKITGSFHPDVIHIHNLYPLISPSVLPCLRSSGAMVVMTVHNYRLVCPNGLCCQNDTVCELCSGGREWNCLFRNCEADILKSAGYALRNAWARIAGYYLENIDAFLCLTGFQKRKLVENGIPEERCHVLPNFVSGDYKTFEVREMPGKGFLFIGRLNRQKGVDILIRAAVELPHIQFTLIGSIDEHVVDLRSIPSNVRVLGVVSEEEKHRQLDRALALVFTSRSYEGFPMVFLEAMIRGLPVVAPRFAGYPEIVSERETGWLFEPENSSDLVRTLQLIHDEPLTAVVYGRNSIDAVRLRYGPDVWYENYMNVIRGDMK